MIGWESSWRETQNVVMRSRERLTGAIHRCRPVHCLLWQVDGEVGLGAGGFHQGVVAGLATLHGDTPAIDRRLHGMNLSGNQQKSRGNCEHCPYENPRYHVQDALKEAH